jgi:hypothetical protein
MDNVQNCDSYIETESLVIDLEMYMQHHVF